MLNFSKKAGSFIEHLSDVSGWLGGSFIVIMIPLISYEVFMRYVFNKAPMVADEFSAYLLVACVFIGLAYTMKEGGHIRVEVVISRIRPQAAKWLRLITLLVALGVTVILFITSFEFLQSSIRLELKSESWLQIPEYIPKMALPVGLFLFFWQLLVEVGKTIKSLRMP